MFTQPANAMHSIKTIAFQRIPISLACTYKGLLFDEKVTPLRVTPEQVVFSAPRQQMCGTLRDTAHLHSRALPESVLANVQSINYATNEMTLSNFRFTGKIWRDRYEQRVQPILPIPAMITINNHILEASLTDLSVHGAGLIVSLHDTLTNEPPAKAQVDINFQLDSVTRLAMRGSVAYARRIGASLLNLGLRLFPVPNQESTLNTYITNRKIEIMGDLSQENRGRTESSQASNHLR
jgi:hypothetical protein